MIRLGNRGQSLAIFVIFIPVIIMIGVMVVDVTFARYNARKLDNITKMVVRYGLDHIDGEPYNNMVDLIYQNDDSVDSYTINIDEENKQVSVTINKATKGFFGSIIGKEAYKEKSNFVGYIKDEKKIIEKGVTK